MVLNNLCNGGFLQSVEFGRSFCGCFAENFVAEAVVFMVSHYLGKIWFEMWWFGISSSSEGVGSGRDGPYGY